MRKPLFLLFAVFLTVSFSPSEGRRAADPPIYIAFLWHMHQPIYWPYETVVQTDQNQRYDYSVTDIHDQRTGPYTSWPKEAVQKGIDAGFAHFGAQVSVSGSLIENLNDLEAAGDGNFQGWKGNWSYIKTQTTSLGNPRLDMVGFGYHHPLMGLLDTADIRRQIQAHKSAVAANFSGSYSKGIFPPENAFSPRMVPALAAEGFQWVLVDNIHFDRACRGYPYSTDGNLVEPNAADARNADPGDWIQLTGLWAPTRVSARWGHQPHYVEYVDPGTGEVSRIIAVPADRYMGNEDGRGGFGALDYEGVMSQLEPYNTDPDHPILVVLHHDGDNYGGGSDSYYHNNFQDFVDWLQANPSRFVCTTVQDYLDTFPPETDDVIHVEDGSWSGADNGDPEFQKWLGDPAADGYSPDRNSWAVVTAAKNFVVTADRIDSSASDTQNAWKYFLNAESSDYWYWDGSQDGKWDSHPTRACNLALPYAEAVVSGGTDLTGPTIFLPQREPYNPGGTEWGVSQPADFTVWTFVFDVSGLDSVSLRVRVDLDGTDPPGDDDNETYAGGPGVGAWNALPMTASDMASRTDPLPLYRAHRYEARVTGQSDVLLDYYVEAVDTHGNVSRSPIRHVWVGSGSGTPGSGVSWTPAAPADTDTVTVTVTGSSLGAKLHWGVNGFTTPIEAYRPPGTTLFNGTGPAVETPMNQAGSDLALALGPFDDPTQPVETVDFVIHYDDDTWDNNGGQDYHIPVGGSAGEAFVMDGALDAGVDHVGSCNGLDLYLGWNGSDLYVASQAAASAGSDVFLFVSDGPGALTAAPWVKAGQVASWAAYLGNEADNNWTGWFDQQGAADQAAGSFVEGVLNLAGEFGAVPPAVYVAAARYETPDGGTLVAQCPAGNGDGHVDAAEFHEYVLSTTGAIAPARDLAVRLFPAAPNPMRRATVLAFSLQWPGDVTLRLFDLRGRRVRTIADGWWSAGLHVVRFDGSGLAPGIYFYRMQAAGFDSTRKLVVLH